LRGQLPAGYAIRRLLVQPFRAMTARRPPIRAKGTGSPHTDNGIISKGLLRGLTSVDEEDRRIAEIARRLGRVNAMTTRQVAPWSLHEPMRRALRELTACRADGMGFEWAWSDAEHEALKGLAGEARDRVRSALEARRFELRAAYVNGRDLESCTP
jgi:hypothetical protein